MGIARLGAECFVIAIIAPKNDSSGTAPNCHPRRKLGLAELSTQLVPPEYHDYLSICLEEEAKALPLCHYEDHTIPLIYGGKPPFG